MISEDIYLAWQDGEPPPRTWKKRHADTEYPYVTLAAAVRSRRPHWVLVHDLPHPQHFINRFQAGTQHGFPVQDAGFEAHRRGTIVAIRYDGDGPDVPAPDRLERDAPPMRITYAGLDDPLPNVRNDDPGLHPRIAAELKSQPGRWAIVRGANNDWQVMVGGASHPAYAPVGAFQAWIREGDVWVRYVGDRDAA